LNFKRTLFWLIESNVLDIVAEVHSPEGRKTSRNTSRDISRDIRDISRYANRNTSMDVQIHNK